MNKIKDIIYNKSDILVALIILALAALIIVWRLGIILEYPKTVLGTDDAQTILTNPEDNQGESGESGEATAETGDNTGEANVDDQTGTQPGDTGEVDEPQDSGALFEDGVLTRDLTVNIPSDVTTAYGAVMCLVEAGIFENYDEYKNICIENGLDHEKMRSGSFTFPKGSTKLDIIKKVNWS